ncbi:Rad52/Rad22 family DNA repair protein [Streptomyces sp. NPDC058297]|uniref:Rad52/Rad22 family DNA repair protein n=1 Tax=Streptomyces sp. NPDC058297 TaxID=3346433 RepID=UPI0036E5E768
MAHAIEAPASTTAEGPTSHTQNQVIRLTAPQLRLLHRPVDPKRIGKDDKNFAHMEAWDIKRYLIRVFGFGGYDTENRELALVREIEIPAGTKSRWTVVYRAQVRLTVKDTQGRILASWDGEAAGGASNQPKLDDAHDMAMKTASSQALKRAATHLGDAFGLSLYNGGDVAPVVNFSAAHPPEQWEKTAAPLPETEDAPVRPEPGSQATEDPAPAAREQSAPAPAPEQQHPQPAGDKNNKLPRLMQQIRECWNTRLPLVQIQLEGNKLGLSDEQVQGPTGAWTTFDELVDGRIQELKQAAMNANSERSAA